MLRGAYESFLIGVRGAPRLARNVRSVVDGAVRSHSRKPDQTYAAAERLVPGARRADLFSRQSRPGWDAWSDEAGQFDST